MGINQSTIATNFGVRSTFVEVNLSQLSLNLQAIREQVAPAKVMIVVKANAYGHGLTDVVKHLDLQVDYIAVAVLEEGILLREIGVRLEFTLESMMLLALVAVLGLTQLVG